MRNIADGRNSRSRGWVLMVLLGEQLHTDRDAKTHTCFCHRVMWLEVEVLTRA